MCTETNKGASAFNKDEIKWRMEMWYECKDDNGDHFYVENNETKEKTYINVMFLNITNLKLIPRIGESVATDGVLYEVKDIVYDYDSGIVRVETIWKHPVDCGCDNCNESCWKNEEKFKKFKKNNFKCLPKDFFSLPRKAQDMILENVDADRKKRCGEDEECVVENTTKNIYGDTITASAANVIDEIYQDVTNEIKNDCTIYNETRYAKSFEYAERLKNIFSGKSQELMDAVDRYDEKEELKKHAPKEKRGDILNASATNVADMIPKDYINELADKYRKTLEYADMLRNILSGKSQELIETIKTKKDDTKTTCNLMEETDKYFEEHKDEIQDFTKKNLELDKCHEGDETNFYVACGDCTNGGASTGIVGTPEQLENVVKNHTNIAWHTKEELVDTPASWKIGDTFTYRVPFCEEDNPKYKDWHGSTIVITDIIPAFHPETFDLVVIFLIKNLKTGEERKLSGTEFGCLKKIGETEEITKID